MQIVLHAGAHVTDEGRLLKSLLRNATPFAARGIAVPHPSLYRAGLRSAITTLHDVADPGPDLRPHLLAQMQAAGQPEPERLILSYENLFAFPTHALDGGVLYRRATERLAEIADLFAGDTITLFLGLRNPASFLPALAAQTDRAKFDAYLAITDVYELCWSRLIEDLRRALPAIDITAWANEDTPLIWGTLLREMAGIEPNVKITGAFDLLTEIMTKEGMARFRAYLKEHPVMTEMQKRRVISAFLDKFARLDQIEEVVDLDGWTDDLVADVTEGYEEDLYHIARIPGVTLIAP